MSVDILRPADFPTWAALWHAYLNHVNHNVAQVVPVEQYRRTFDRMLDDKGDIYGVVIRDPDTGAIVGFSHYTTHARHWSEKRICHMSDLFVDEGFRRRGYGRKLIMATAEAAKKLDCCRLSWVMENDNTVAKPLYDSLAVSEFAQYRMNL